MILPMVSEKAFAGTKRGIYTFKVTDGASKPAIKRAVEEQFGVTVIGVNTAKVPAKTKRRGRFEGVKPGFRKAVVTLKKGDKIEELEG